MCANQWPNDTVKCGTPYISTDYKGSYASILRSKPLENFDKWRIAGLYSYLAYLEQEEIEQFIGLLDKEDSEIQEKLDKENYEEFKLLEQGLREIKDHKEGFHEKLFNLA